MQVLGGDGNHKSGNNSLAERRNDHSRLSRLAAAGSLEFNRK